MNVICCCSFVCIVLAVIYELLYQPDNGVSREVLLVLFVKKIPKIPTSACMIDEMLIHGQSPFISTRCSKAIGTSA